MYPQTACRGGIYSRFIGDCARNASEIEAIWRDQGSLASSRVDALARMWAHVVSAALLNGLDEFELGARTVQPPCHAAEPVRGRLPAAANDRRERRGVCSAGRPAIEARTAGDAAGSLGLRSAANRSAT